MLHHELLQANDQRRGNALRFAVPVVVAKQAERLGASFVQGLLRDFDHPATYQFRFSFTDGQELMPGTDSAHSQPRIRVEGFFASLTNHSLPRVWKRRIRKKGKASISNNGSLPHALLTGK